MVMLIKQSIKESQKSMEPRLKPVKVRSEYVKDKETDNLTNCTKLIWNMLLVILSFALKMLKLTVDIASNRQLDTKYKPVTSTNIDAKTIASINKTIQTDDTCAFNSLIFSKCCFSNK